MKHPRDNEYMFAEAVIASTASFSQNLKGR